MTSVTPTTCHNCGAALYRQWWSKSKGGYECRRCGALTAGTAGIAPTWTPPSGGMQETPRSGIGLGIALGIGVTVLILLSGESLLLAASLGLVVLVLANREQDSRARLSALERSVATLSAGPQATSAARPAPSPSALPPIAPLSTSGPAVSSSVVQPPIAEPSPAPIPVQPSFIEVRVQRLRSASSAELEHLVAGRLLPIVGGVALVAAAVFSLGLAFSRGWIGEEGRVLIGLAAGMVTFGVGALLLGRRQPIIGHILIGVGLSVVSLALFAATQLYQLAPAEAGVLGALAVDLTAAAIAIRFRSQVVAGLGLVTVLAAPPITGASPTVITLLFLGVALVATTAIAIYQSWRWLPSVAFLLTAPQLAAYAVGLPDPLQAVPVLLGFGVLNAIASAGEEWRVLRRDLSPSSAILLAASAGFVVWGALTVLVGDAARWEGIVVLIVGIGHLGLGGSFLYRGGDRHPFGMLAVGTGIAAATLAVPLQFGGAPVPMIWALGSLALTWVYVSRRHPLSGLAAVTLGLLAVGHLMGVEYSPSLIGAGSSVSGLPFANAAGLALGWTLAVGVAAMAMLRTNVERSYVAAVLLTLVAWGLPHEFTGVTLIWTWGLVAVVASAACWRWVPVRPTDTFALLPQAVPIAPVTLMLVVGFAALLGYGTTLVSHLPPGDLLGGAVPLPPIPFFDVATGAVLGLVVPGLAAGAIGDRSRWRAGSAILAAWTVAYLLPFEAPLAWVIVGWSLLGAGLLAVSEWVVRQPIVGGAGDALGAIAIGLWLVAVMPPTSLVAGAGVQLPVFNAGTVAGLSVIGLLAFRFRLSSDPRERLGFAAIAGIGAVYLVSVAVVDAVEWLAASSVSYADLWYIGQVALSVCWATLGLGTLLAGLALRSLPVRVFGLALLGMATAKVFLVDMASLDIVFRVLSFLGLGLLLIGTGWVYLRLQGRTTSRPAP